MVRRRLPIGIQTFREVRQDGCYYVDKTRHIGTLAASGKHYFLSRPRRFGKSLFLDTLKELFEGSEELFQGLAIHGQWDWSVRNPVVRLDFSQGDFTVPGYLHRNAMAQLDGLERRVGVASGYDTAPERLSHLLETLHERTGERVVVLVDEYDKPILDALEDADLARANRNYLRGLYSTLKFADAHVRLSFITGVSKFNKVSLFSGLNNLLDITLDPQYSTICGYTEADLDAVFAPELPGLDRAVIREWYNGYSWLGEEKVYNPFDILLLFNSREFKAHWLETGSPTFLVDLLFRRRVRSVDFDGMLASDDLLSAFDVDEIAPEALLFQTGYLTIREREDLGGETFYRLGYPNREVRQGLNRSLLRRLGQGRESADCQQHGPIPAAGGGRRRGHGGACPRILCRHPAPVAHEQRHRRLRGILRKRVLLVLRWPRARRGHGGEHKPRPPRHGGALREPGVRFRVQGGGAGRGRQGDGTTQRAGLRGEVPCTGRGCPPDRRRIQQRVAQRGRVRARRGVT